MKTMYTNSSACTWVAPEDVCVMPLPESHSRDSGVVRSEHNVSRVLTSSPGGSNTQPWIRTSDPDTGGERENMVNREKRGCRMQGFKKNIFN